MGTKQQRGAATVEQVLDAAARLYAESGEAGLTVARLTAATGVSSGSVYHHFGSLDGVLVKLAERWLGMLFGDMVAGLAGAADARAGVTAIVESYLDFMAARPDAAELLHSVTADRHGMAHAREIRDNQEARLTPIARWIEARRADGGLLPLPTPLIESLILGPVVGAVRRWVAVGDIDLAEARAALPERIWRSVEP